jgi:hypothetical protein
VLTKQRRIAENARNLREASLTALAHHIDVQWLRVAEELVRKDGAPGVDGVTGHEYEKDVEEPDALIGLVRICGGLGGAIPRLYPEGIAADP